MANKPESPIEFYALEDRVLLSGDSLDGVLDTPVDQELVDALLADGFATENAETPEAPTTAEELGELAPGDTQSQQQSLALEVVFIDEGVEDADQLIADLQGRSDSQFLIFRLSSDEDGIARITEELSSLTSVDAIHLVSHGDENGIQLGGTRLDAGNVNSYAGAIASWASSMDLDADILIYGCDLAGSDEGRFLIDSLGALCDCDVAASDDITGHADLGGDWEFEYIVGVVETDLAFSAAVQENWNGTLASVTVTTLDDVVDRTASSIANLVNNPGADGVISLREAIIAANANPDADVIYLGAGVHTLSISDLDINADVQIIGLANGSTVVDASGLFDMNTMSGERVFSVFNNSATFEHLTITGGHDTSSSGGGGIRIQNGAEATLNNVVVTDNHSTTLGGGIANFGTLTVTNSTISSNTAGTDGGGISSSSSIGVQLTNVTVSGNEAGDEGGGVRISNGSSHDLTNVTLSGNEANDGGGFATAGTGTGVDLTNVTIAGNTANNDGGGIFNRFGQSNVDVTATIISGNMATNDANVDSSHFDDLGFNRIDDDPNLLMLGDLADNGGPVQTHALLPGSSAIDAAGSQDETDSRGFLVNDNNRDIGAFEFGATPASQLAGLLFTTATDVSGSAVTGLDDWDNQDVIQIRDPDLTIENGDGSTGASDGSFSELIDFEAFADGTTHPTAGVDALHRVGTHITFLGVDLQPGDVLFSTTQATLSLIHI